MPRGNPGGSNGRMIPSRTLCLIAATAFGLAGCQQPPPVEPPESQTAHRPSNDPQSAPRPGPEPAAQDPDQNADPALATEARALLHAAPEQWGTRFAAVVARGAPMAAVLAAEVRAEVDAVPAPEGLHAAIGALEALGCGEARDALQAIAGGGGPAAADSALALGALPDDPESARFLETLATDRAQPEGARAAAAASLLRLGHGQRVRSLLHALLLAGTPAGQQLAETHGLPAKQRWALERHYLLRAMRIRAGETFGLDTDAPWPQLEAGTQAFLAWLETDNGGAGR